MTGEILLLLLAAALVGAGMTGIVVPVLPGAPLVFAGLVLAAWAEDFAHVGAFTLALLGLLAAASYVVDFLAGAFGAKRFGASPRAVWGAALGGLVGLLFGLPGILIGPFAGAVAGELSARRGWRDAGLAGVGATLGLVIGAAFKIAIAATMIGLWLLDRFVWELA